ncbi:MAG: MinD/ParA family protein, partial [Cyanobacteria bacterium J06553_1]
MPKVISIHSYRGGTGKSNFTANLAATLASQGHCVGVVDTDVPSPGIHNLFCLEPEHTTHTLNNYLWGEIAIEEAAYEVSDNVGLETDSGGKLYLVPSSVKADSIARILRDGYDVRLMNDGFRKLVKALSLDYLLIDTHPGLSKETFLSIAISHVLILILRPDKQDYQGTAVTMDVAKQLKVRKLLLAINKVYRSLSPEVIK